MTATRSGTIGDRPPEPASPVPPPAIDEFGVLRYGGRWLSLTRTEEAIVRYLIQNLGQPVSRPSVAAATWPHGGRDHHAINVHIHRLRPRLADLGLIIHTLRSRGFLLETLSS